MALRVKNVQAGYKDEHGFHPLRKSFDYDPDHPNLTDSSASRTDGAGLKFKGYKVAFKKKSGAKRVYGKKAGGRVVKPAAKKRTTKAKKRATTKRRVLKNPISTKWMSAKVKRLANGDIQVMIPLGKG